MISKKELIADLEELTRLEMSFKDKTITEEDFDRIVRTHQKRQEIWHQIGQINELQGKVL